MKYIIAEKKTGKPGELIASIGGMYHSDMHTYEMGKIVAAGHCQKLPNGKFLVWGSSVGYNMMSKPEDALMLEELLK